MTSRFLPLLAFDTSADRCVAAVLTAERLIECSSDGGPAASAELLPLLDRTLDLAGLRIEAIAAIAFGAGPGSFTGVRTSTALAQAIACAAPLPLAPVCTLMALAQSLPAASVDQTIVAVIDARMNEIYYAMYRRFAGVDEEARWQTLIEPSVASAQHARAQLRGFADAETWTVIGRPDLLSDQPATATEPAQYLPAALTGAMIAHAGLHGLLAGNGVNAASAQPIYVRNKVAQTIAERTGIILDQGLPPSMSSLPRADAEIDTQLSLQPMMPGDLDTIAEIETSAYAFPWTRGNFADSLAAHYSGWILRRGAELLGYSVFMIALDEAHLLNLTIAPAHQHRGLGRRLLHEVLGLAREQQATRILLEVRPSNLRALRLYEIAGFRRIGLRHAYYPSHQGQREDAVVMARGLSS